MKKHSETKLDSLWKNKVFLQFNGRCCLCSSQSGLSAHHVRLRRYRNTRWDLSNGILLCELHHAMAHRNVKFFENLIRKRFGDEWFESLKKKSLEFFDGDYERIEKELKGE